MQGRRGCVNTEIRSEEKGACVYVCLEPELGSQGVSPGHQLSLSGVCRSRGNQALAEVPDGKAGTTAIWQIRCFRNSVLSLEHEKCMTSQGCGCCVTGGNCETSTAAQNQYSCLRGFGICSGKAGSRTISTGQLQRWTAQHVNWVGRTGCACASTDKR